MYRGIQRCLSAVLGLGVLVSLSGCGQTIGSQPTEETVLRPIPLQSPIVNWDSLESQTPLELLTGVETDKKVVALVFEGWTEDADMNQLLQELRAKKIPAWFLVSGVTADEHSDFVTQAAGTGFGIANDGISSKGMEDAANASEYRHQYEKTSQLLRDLNIPVLSVGGLNGASCTDAVLRGAAAAGLESVIRGTAYLNHRSFSTENDAKSFVNNMIRGGLIVLKLGSELSDEEFGDSDVMWDEKPAIDLGPGIGRDDLGTVAREQHNIAEAVSWLLDALDADGYKFVDPQALQKYEVPLLTKTTELDEAFQALVNPLNYSTPVTETPLTVGQTHAGTSADLRKAAFVGDSVTEGLMVNTQWHQSNDSSYYPGLTFFTASNASVELLIEDAVFDSSSGKTGKVSLENALAAQKPELIYLMLRPTAARALSNKTYLANYRLLISRIQKKNPDAKIIVQSIPPYAASHQGSPTNAQIFRYNLMLCSMCQEYGITFLDTAYALRDANGCLKQEYCLDEATEGRHLNDAGCAAWLEYLCANIPG